MHALILPSWYPTRESPGTGVFFREQAQALRAAGLRVGVVYPELRSIRSLRPAALRGQRFQTEWRVDEGIPTGRVLGWNLIPRLVAGGDLWAAFAARLAREYVRRHGRPDVIHAHGAIWAGWAARKLAASLGVPYVVTEHFTGFARGNVSAAQRAAVRRVYADAGRVVAVSRPLGDLLVEGGLAPAATLEVIPNLVHTGFFTLPPAGAGRRGGPGFRFVGAGALVPWKGFDRLIRAFAGAFEGDAAAELHIVGSGPEEGALRALAGELGVEGRVVLRGQLSREQVRGAMWDADAFVLASAVETFGVVFIEALSTGLPLVATASGGPEDIVTPEVGRIVPVGDDGRLRDALRWARHESRGLSAAGLRASAVDRFSAERVAERIGELYARVVREHRRA